MNEFCLILTAVTEIVSGVNDVEWSCNCFAVIAPSKSFTKTLT